MKRKRQVKRRTNEDTQQRRKYKRGGRIEAYTFGEVLKKNKDKVWG